MKPRRLQQRNSASLHATVLLLCALLAAATPVWSQTTTTGPFNPATNFSATLDPNGVWSYGWSVSRGATFQLMASNFTSSPSGIIGWCHVASPCEPVIFFNPTSGTVYPASTNPIPPGQLAMHPGASGENAVLRWTAPAAGTYIISGQFKGLDTVGTTTDVTILHGSTQLFSANVTGFYTNGGAAVQSFSITETVQAGDVIDFTVGFGNGSYSYDSTGLDLTITTVSCSNPSAGLVSWWPGDGNTNDIIGNNPGSLQGGATYAAGQVGQAFSFDGVSSSVTFGNSAGNFGTSDFTVEFWMKTTSTRYEDILGKRGLPCGPSSFWHIRMGGNVPTGHLQIEVDQDSNSTNYVLFGTTRAVNDGVFHHVAVVRQGTSVRAYIDGVLDSTAATAGVTNIVNSVDLAASRSACTASFDGTQFFTGLEDEISIYNRALSATEIQTVFNAGSAGKCKPAPAVGAIWHLDEGTGQVAADSSGRGNNGQLGATSSADTSDPTWITGRIGAAALNFNGSQFVEVPDSVTLEPAAVSVETWVRRLGSPGGTIYVVSKGASGFSAASYALYTGASGGLFFYVFNGSTFVLSPNAGTGIWDGNWHHVVGTFDGSTVRLYVDGAQVGSGTPTSIAIAYGLPTNERFYIGAYRGSGDAFFNGDIDEVRVWRQALTPAEVAARFQGQELGGTEVPDLGVTIADSPDPVTRGSNLTYTITVSNSGSGLATDVTLTDPLPGAVSFVSVTTSQGSCSGTSTILCALGSVASGASATVTLIVTTTVAGSLTNTVSVAGGQVESNTANNTATATTQVNLVTFSGIVAPFSTDYSGVDLGAVPGVPTNYGGLTFKFDNPNILLIGGAANSASGRLYAIQVVRDAQNHVIGFSGTATLVADEAYNDGGLAYGPDNVLFYTRYPVNEIGQIKPASAITDKIVALTPLGVASSVGGLNFVPPGFPGAGQLKIASYNSRYWYSSTVVPDSSGTFDITNVVQRTQLPYAPEGFLYVPAGSPRFQPFNTLLLNDYSVGQVGAYQLDSNGDPIPSTRTTFISGLTGAEGAATDPLTGDFLFSTYGGGNRVIVIRGFSAPVTSCVPAPAGLVAWWRAEGNAADAQGNHQGAVQNGATFATGEVGQAFSFDGVNDFVQVPDSPAWAFGTNEFTIDFWVNFAALPGSDQVFIGNDEGGGGLNKWFFMRSGSGNLVWHINSPTLGPKFFSLAPFTPNLNQWYHIALTRIGSTYTVYVNGSVAGSATITDAVPDANAPLTIGQAENNFFLHGLMDEVEIYNRALTASEIQSIVNAGSFGKCVTASCVAPPAGLVSSWPGEGGATDVQSNNHGSLMNGVSSAPGVVGHGLQFDGIDDFVQIPDSPSLKPTQVTVDAWVKFDSLDTAGASLPGLQYLVFKRNSRLSQFEGYALLKVRVGSADQFQFVVSSAAGVQAIINSTTTIVAGQFYHVAGTYDGTAVKIFVNGVLEGQTTASFPLDYGTRPVFFGTTGESFNGNFAGVLDEVEIYNRALAAAEIQAIVAAGSVGKCRLRACVAPPIGLVGWWPGDGNTNDIIGTNAGTLQNGATFATGKVNQAFSLDGIDDVVSTPLTVSYAGGVTFDAWIKTTADRGAVMAGGGGSSAENGMGLFVQPVGPLFPLGGQIGLFGSRGVANQGNFLVVGPVVNDGAFHHVAGVWTGDTTADGVKLYVDGVLVGTATALQSITTTTDSRPLNIGGHTIEAYYKFAGVIDEVEVYSRALSAGEIQAIFAAGSDGKCKTRADLRLTKTGSPSSVNLGSNLTYTLTVTNNGPNAASNVTIADGLPAAVTFSSATPSQGACSEASGLVTCALGTVPSAATATVTAVVSVNQGGSLANTASVIADESDPDATNNSAQTVTLTGSSISGRVTRADDGTPIAGATVQALVGGFTVAGTRTDTSGNYSLRVPPDVYDVRAVATGFLETVRGELSVGSDTAYIVDLTLSTVPRPTTPAVVTGRVYNRANGLGLANATVQAFQGGVLRATARTFPDGRYLVALPPGRYDFVASANGFEPFRVDGVDVSSGTTTLNFSLRPVPH